MKKIPTLFVREFTPDHRKTLTQNVTKGCEAVLRGECSPTTKWDGACCAIIKGEIYKRYDAKNGKNPPVGAIPCQPEPDPITTHWPHWVKCEEGKPEDKYFFEALENFKSEVSEKLFYHLFCVDDEIRTLEAVGPAWQSNPHGLPKNTLIVHGADRLDDFAESVEEQIGYGKEIGASQLTPDVLFDLLEDYLRSHEIEGIVFWRDGSPLCKIKRSDFGFPWPVKKGGAEKPAESNFVRCMQSFWASQSTDSETPQNEGTKMKYTYDENGVRTDAPEWFKRLHAEWNELRERRNKLKAFLAKSDAPATVSIAQSILLEKQLKVMNEYCDILYVRMTLANDEFAIVKDPAPMLGDANSEIEVPETKLV